MYAVGGSTGKVGGAVVRALLAEGKEVLALLRDESKAAALQALGAKTFLTSVEDPSGVEQAFEGLEGAFIMTPPLLDAPDPRTENALMIAVASHALQASHVPKVVYLSSIGAEQEEGTGAILKAHDLEQAMMALPIPTLSIRAAYFMENLAPMVEFVRQSGKLPSVSEPLEAAFPMVATEDIGKLAAELLLDTWNGHRIVEIEGPRHYSMNEAAAILSKIVGRDVVAELVPREARKAMYESFGVAAGAADTMVEMADGFNSGLIKFQGGDGTEHRKGVLTLEDVLGKA